MRPLVAALLLCLCSCAAIDMENRRREESEETRKMKAWVGRDVREMVSEYGPPTEKYENGDVVMWIWVFGGSVVTSTSGGTSALYGNSGGGSWGHSTQSTDVIECREWADVDASGMVVGGHWRGNCNYRFRWPPKRAAQAVPASP